MKAGRTKDFKTFLFNIQNLDGQRQIDILLSQAYI